VKRFIAVLALALATLALPVLASAAGGNGTDGTSSGPKVDTSSAIVQLNGAPLATYEKTHPTQGKKIDFSSNTVKSYRAQLSALRNEFKQWLKANAPAAKVTGEFDIALNAVAVQLNGTSLDTLRAGPQVLSADYEGLYYPVVDDPDLGIIDAVQAWSRAGGAANAGAGVKVAIVDTGIDVTHPCFSDAGYAPQQQLGNTRFTNNKVIAAKVFNMNAKNQGYTPEAIQDHGTHVAGTAACNYLTPATVNGVLIPYAMSGVAPRALLGNYNVFPNQVGNARSEDIVDALEAAYEDGFDVANMSLGGGSQGFNDLLADATDNLDEANMVVAVAAGNSGPGHFTIESPGKAARALTAGASTVPHFVGSPMTVGGTSFGLASGDFATVSSDLTAPLGVVLSGTALSTACSSLTAGSLTGKIAVISRGTCTFSTKIRNAQAAGAVAAVVVNNVAGDPVAMAQDGTANQPTIPAYMTSLANRSALIAANGQPATIGATLQYFLTTNVDIMAGFSSQGPTDVDFRVKPDVVAPGVNVLSSVPATACAAPPCFAFFQGTSMATPHLAGSAAVVRGQHPDWSAAQIRSAIVNTAEQGVLRSFNTATTVTDVNVIGAGRENLDNAVQATVALDPVSVSFGAVPSGSGQTKTATVQLSLGSGPYTVSVNSSTGTGVSYSASVSGSTITVTMSAAKSASAGDHQATLRVLRGGAEVAHAAVYTLIK
jgi:subtilisin family serine protease